jgi:murein DD-endopeptidase MepM/ murein hydrolase activator NlpD
MKFTNKSASGSNSWDFFTAVFSYFFRRLRLLYILTLVSIEVFVNVFYNLKRLILRYMFWGRVKGYRIVVAGLVVFIMFVTPFVFYREPITVETYADDDKGYATIAKNDLLIEQGSSQTLIPKDRNRMDVTTYKVKRGDTLSTIAEKFDLKTDTIAWANDLESAHVIKPGMVLKIPPGDGVLHKVEGGDTLSDLASKYKASEQAIADVNWLDPPFNLDEGVVLFIPDGTMPPPPKPEPTVATNPTSTPSNNNSGGGGNTGTPVSNPSSSRFLGWPVAGGTGNVTQCFSGWHNGIDIANSSWPNIVAAAGGTVTFAGCQSGSCPPPGSSVGGYGLAWAVVIDHGNGYSTVYGHLNNLYVSSGQQVGAGTPIGQMGQSGSATGVHVHFMVVRSGSWSGLNPAPFMRNHVCGY